MSILAGGHYHPLWINTQTEEPFLRLKEHKNIIITPPRQDDSPTLCTLMNHPLVYEWSEIPTRPYHLAQASEQLAASKQRSDAVVARIREAQGEARTEAITVGACPVEWIRVVQPDGSMMLIGGILCSRCDRGEFLGSEGPKFIDWEHRDELREENMALEVGDPDIVWRIQVFLAPSWHGQGIGRDAIKTVLFDWLVPRMGVRRVVVFAVEGNHGGVKAFLKAGFKHIGLYGQEGTRRRSNVLEWRLDDDET